MKRFLLCVCVCSCSRVDVGLSPAETGSSGVVAETTTTTTSSSGPERVDTSDGMQSTTPSTGEIGSTSTSTTSGGDTEGLEESPCQAEQKVCAEVELDGAPVGFCGQTLTLLGNTSPLGPGRWAIVDCDACEPCAGTSYDVQIIAPAGWVPTELPDCARIAIDFAPLDDSPFACAFTGIAIWDELGGSTEDPAPVYVAASILTDPPAAVTGLQVAKTNIEPKACVEPDCCWMDPGKYSLTFSGAALGAPVELLEHEMAMGITAFSQPYDLRDERSHAHEQCDKIPHFDWILRR
jgi:hypothetical protein